MSDMERPLLAQQRTSRSYPAQCAPLAVAFGRKKPAVIGIKAPFPRFVEPALTTSIEKAPSGEAYESKGAFAELLCSGGALLSWRYRPDEIPRLQLPERLSGSARRL